MTRHAPIRMNPNRLPELTDAQKARVKAHREYWKNIGKMSIVRKGQLPGHVLISVTEPDKVRRMLYDIDGQLVRMVIEEQLFTLTAEPEEPTNALYLNTKDD